MLIIINIPNVVHTDERGSLTQLVREGYCQVNVVQSKGGTFRGNHFHAKNTETFYIISGALDLTVVKDGITEEYKFKSGDMFSIPPNVVHNFSYTKDTYLVGMYDKGVETMDSSGNYTVTDIIGE